MVNDPTHPVPFSLPSVGGAGSLLESDLSVDVEQDNQVKSVSKELFNKVQIDLKTEVTHDEINNIARLRFLEDKYNVRNINTLIDSFLRLRVSKNRKSRQEFIQALQTETKNAQGQSMWNKIFGGAQ